MKKTILIASLTIWAFTLLAQDSNTSENDSLTNLLVGVWEIEKVVDKMDNEVKTISKEMKGSPLGDEIKITATGPKITLNADGSYELEFNQKNIDKGSWVLEYPDTLFFQLVSKKGTSDYNMLKIAAEMFGKKVPYDSDGNIVENIPREIVKLEKDKLIIRYEINYFQIYRKKK